MLLTVLSAPFFVFVYYLIVQGYEQQYRVDLVNNDTRLTTSTNDTSYGKLFLKEVYLSNNLSTFKEDRLIQRKKEKAT